MSKPKSSYKSKYMYMQGMQKQRSVNIKSKKTKPIKPKQS